MNPRITALLGTVWMISLVLAGALGWRLSPRRSEAPRGPVRAGPDAAPADALPSPEIERLKEENAALRRALEGGEGEPPPAVSPVDAPSGKAIAEARRIAYYLDRFFSARREDLLFSDLDEATSLALYVAQVGSAGVEQMVERALNAELADERMLCLEVLSMVADPLALKTILEYPWADVAETSGWRDSDSWDWTMVGRHLEQLPSSALTPHFETLEKRLREEVDDGAGDLSEEGLRACAQLAFRHGSPGSLALLRQTWPGLDADAKGSLVDYLLFIETGASLDFLGEVSAGDASQAARTKATRARAILAEHLKRSGGR